MVATLLHEEMATTCSGPNKFKGYIFARSIDITHSLVATVVHSTLIFFIQKIYAGCILTYTTAQNYALISDWSLNKHGLTAIVRSSFNIRMLKGART